MAYADQEGLALDVSGYLPDGELYIKPLMSKLKPNYPGITWLNESKENTMRKLKETSGLPHYAKGVRRVVDGVVDEIAGLDHDMAVLCLAIWNLKLERTEEDPTEDLIDLWNSGKGNYCLSDGRRPGPKEAAALKALLAEFNDIIADQEENLRESLFGMRPRKAAFCRDANNKRLTPGNTVNTPDGEGEIDKVSGTRGEYFISVNGQEYRSTECYKLHEAKARAKFSYRPKPEGLAIVEKMVDDEYGCYPSAEYSEREHEIQVTVIAGSSIRTGLKKAFKAAKLDTNFNLRGIYLMPSGDEHMYCVPQFSDQELASGEKKPLVRAPTVEEIVSEALFDVDKWLRLYPEDLEGLSAQERHDSIEASVDADIEDFFRSSSYEIDQGKIPSIKKRIISRLAK